jgi:hypothetical protein
MLGFANDSGVSKRVKKIGAEFIEYMKPCWEKVPTGFHFYLASQE